MAASYTLSGQNILFGANKCMLSVYNGSGSGAILRVYRAWVLNNQQTAVTGVLTNLELRKITASSGGTTLTATKHDSNSSNLAAQIVLGTNQTITTTDLYRRVIWSTDEPSNASGTTAATLDEFEIFLPLCCIWSLGYGDSTTEPITLREGEGLALVNTGGNTGQCDVFFEFTSGAS